MFSTPIFGNAASLATEQSLEKQKPEMVFLTQNDGSDDDDADNDDGGEDNDDGDEEEQSWKTKPRNYVVWHDYDNDGDGGDDDDDKKQRLEKKSEWCLLT